MSRSETLRQSRHTHNLLVSSSISTILITVFNKDSDDVWTCVEDQEIIRRIPSQNASIHIDIVSHDDGAVSEALKGHAPNCDAIPGQRHCYRMESHNLSTYQAGLSPRPSFDLLTYIKAVDSRETLGGVGAGRSSQQIQLPSDYASEETGHIVTALINMSSVIITGINTRRSSNKVSSVSAFLQFPFYTLFVFTAFIVIRDQYNN